jgi:hypothetical protein
MVEERSPQPGRETHDTHAGSCSMAAVSRISTTADAIAGHWTTRARIGPGWQGPLATCRLSRFVGRPFSGWRAYPQWSPPRIRDLEGEDCDARIFLFTVPGQYENTVILWGQKLADLAAERISP